MSVFREYSFRLKGATLFLGVCMTILSSACAVSNEATNGFASEMPNVLITPTPALQSPKGLAQIAFISSTTWIVLDDPGNFWKTENAGETWKITMQFAKKSARNALKFISPSVGFMLVDETLWKTSDAGETWQLITNFKDLIDMPFDNLYGLFFLNENDGWCVGSSYSSKYGSDGFEGKILHTADGGRTWQEQKIKDARKLVDRTGHKWDVRDLWFTNEQIGWAVGRGVVLRTKNVGLDWELTKETEEIEGYFENVIFLNDSSGLILEQETEGSIFTTNGGRTWKSVELPDIQRTPSLLLNRWNDLILFESNGKISLKRINRKEWKQAAILEEDWKMNVEKDSFGYPYMGKAMDGSLVCVWHIEGQPNQFLYLTSHDDGRSWGH